MARMSIDDKFLRDPNVRVLAKLCGWSVRETRGCLLDVWAICYDQMTALLSKAVIDVAAELEGFADKLVQAELASVDRSGRVRIRGASKRIEYLLSQRERGSQGGTKRAYSPDKNSSKRLSTHKADAQALTPTTLKPLTLTVPDTPSAEDTDTPTAGDRERETARDRAKSSKPKRQLTSLSDDWIPTRSEANERGETEARSRGVHVRGQLEAMRDWARAKGETCKDWDARWRNWLRNAKPAQHARPQQGDGLSWLLEEIRSAEGAS